MTMNFNKNKLEALRVMASREDTPIEERRNAALAYVCGMSANSDDKSPKAIALEAEIDRLQKELKLEKDYSHQLQAENTALRNALGQWARAMACMNAAADVIASPPPKRRNVEPDDQRDRAEPDPHPNSWARPPNYSY
jgi:hypothetical protein